MICQTTGKEEKRVLVGSFEEVCADFGNRVSIEGIRFGYSENVWKYCAPEIRTILLNLLR